MPYRLVVSVLVICACLAGCSATAPDGTKIRSSGGNAALSLFVGPGIGQFCNEQPLKGGVMMAGGITLWSLYLSAIEKDNPDDAALYLGLNMGLGIWSAVDAYIVSEKYNRELGQTACRWGLCYDPVSRNVYAGAALDF